ncbi:VPS10 domain-containing protein [Steroidobacter cummioxidans]|uniref:VPS10 domain-containing protein n=1 Tax=Steroidobacter cummioxidans TaxID=1803913 RepID=UPI001F4EBEFB|nr:hypothetical protein [Steroidobacter cummioxidans]
MFTSLLAGMSAAQAGVNKWTSVGPDGGLVHDLAFHPTDPATMYAATFGGLYRSNDAGASWQLTAPPTTLGNYFRATALAVAVGDPASVHIASAYGDGLRSDDRGLTLSVTTSGVTLKAHSFAIAAAADGSAIYYTVNRGIYLSTDGGRTRQLRGRLLGDLDVHVYKLCVDPSDAQIVYAVTWDGLYRSTDAGASWIRAFAPPALSSGVQTMAIDPQHTGRLWIATSASLQVSDDAGATSRTVLNESVIDIDVDPTDPQIIYATKRYDGNVMRTTDGGTTWTALPVPQRPKLGNERFAIHPADSSRLYLFGDTGILTSTDGGANWQHIDHGIHATSPGQFSNAPASSGHLFFPILGNRIGALRPGEDTVDFTVNTPGTPSEPATEATAILSLPTTLVAAFRDRKIALSSDLGVHWTPAATPPAAEIASLAAVHNGAWTLYAGTSDGLYRSDDLGNHWSPAGNGLPAHTAVGDIAVAADQTTVYTAVLSGTSSNSVVYQSLDGGQSWAPTPKALEKRGALVVAHPTESRTLLVGTNEGAFKTTDAGQTWQALELFPGVTDSPVSAVAIDPVDPDIIYIDSPGAIANMVRSVDGGVSFQRLMPDYYDAGGAVSITVASDPAHLVLAATTGGGVRQMSIQPDLQLAIESPASVAPGSELEFTAKATNKGPFDATGVQVETQLPTGISATSATSDVGTCAISSNFVTCKLGILRTDGTASIRVRATPATSGSLAINAKIEGAQPDSISANNSASASVSVSTPPPPSNPGGGGGGGSFDVFAALAMMWMFLLRRVQRQ